MLDNTNNTDNSCSYSDLTILDAIGHLVINSETERVKKMKGTVRPISRERRCPKCNKLFKHIRKLGYICPPCKTIPTRFFVDIHWNGQRPAIYSDKQGEPLDSYQRASNLLARIQNEIDNHIFDPSRFVKKDLKNFLFENLINSWFKDKETLAHKGQLAWSYLSPLKGHIKNYMMPFFKAKDVRDIKKRDIKGFYKSLPSRLSSNTQKHILDSLQNFFNVLVDDELIEKKPGFPQITVPEAEIKWCTRELQDKILNAIPDKHRFIYFFLSRQGLRPAEAMAMKWQDIDLKSGVLTIKRTVSYRKIVERTKTKKVRPRLLHPDVFEILQSVPKALHSDYVFINPNTGRTYLPDSIQKIWRKAAQSEGTDITLYQATRHSVASMAATSGVSIQIIKEVLGHTDIRTTQKYVHLDVLAHSQVFEAQKEKSKGTEQTDSKVRKLFNEKP